MSKTQNLGQAPISFEQRLVLIQAYVNLYAIFHNPKGYDGAGIPGSILLTTAEDLKPIIDDCMERLTPFQLQELIRIIDDPVEVLVTDYPHIMLD